jgi:hypothetical protein
MTRIIKEVFCVFCEGFVRFWIRFYGIWLPLKRRPLVLAEGDQNFRFSCMLDVFILYLHSILNDNCVLYARF